jgi:hypothetical protein
MLFEMPMRRIRCHDLLADRGWPCHSPLDSVARTGVAAFRSASAVRNYAV